MSDSTKKLGNIKLEDNFKKTRNMSNSRATGGVEIPKSLGKDRIEILTIFKKALTDFREGYSHNRQSYIHKTTEYKLNYLNELLNEKISEQSANLQEILDNEDVELTSEEKGYITKAIREQFSGVSTKFAENVIASFQDKLREILSKSTEDEKGEAKVNIKIDDKIDNSQFLEDYFDNLYKKSEKYQDLKDELTNEMSKAHNENMSLIRERIEEYKKNLLSYENKIKEANETISKLQKQKGGKGNNAITQGNVVGNDDKQKKEEEQKKEQGNLVQQNLLTQQIVDQIRKNEGLAVAPKAKKLGPEHIQFANNLVDKFYKNGLIEFKLKSLKKTLGVMGKVFGLIMAPIGWLVGKVFGAIKSIGLAIFKLGKFVFNSFQSVILTTLLSPSGAYTIGFIAGFVSSFLKDMWENEKGGLGFIKGVWNVIYDCFITPLWNIAKFIYKVVNHIVDFAAKHPYITTALGLTLEGIYLALTNMKMVQGAGVLLKRFINGGWKSLGNAMIGMASSALTKTIFDKTVFSSASDNAIEWYSKSSQQMHTFLNTINQNTIKELNDQDLAKYTALRQTMKSEDAQIASLMNKLEFIQTSAGKADNLQKEDMVTLMKDGFIRAIFTSKLYGFNQDGYDRFIRGHKGKAFLDQIGELMSELTIRQDMLKNMAGIIQHSSKDRAILNTTIDRFSQKPEKDENGNEKPRNSAMEKLRGISVLDSVVGKDRTDSKQIFGEFHGYTKRFVLKSTEKAENDAKYKKGIDDVIAGLNYIGTGYKEDEAITDWVRKSQTESSSSEYLKPKESRASDMYFKASEYTEKYLKDSGINSILFSNSVYYEDIDSIIKKSQGNIESMQKNLKEYYDKVKGEYDVESHKRTEELEQDIKDLDKDIQKLGDTIQGQERKIDDYHKKGIR